MYPDLKPEIERINGNIVDLMIPFSKRNYYTKEMKGSYSIKYVLPALYPDDPEEKAFLLYLFTVTGSERAEKYSLLIGS